MPHRNFRLFEFQREVGVEQRLTYNIPLVGINEEDGFVQLLAEHDTTVKPLIQEGRPLSALILKPPVLKEKIEIFGRAMVDFASSNGYGADEVYGREIRFWDQTVKDRYILVASNAKEHLGELVTGEVVSSDTVGVNV